MSVSIPVGQHERWQKQFEEAQNELRELREWKKGVLENPESMVGLLSHKVVEAERRGDSLAHMRKALYLKMERKLRVAKEAHDAQEEVFRAKLLKKDTQIDQMTAYKLSLETHNAELVANICDLQDVIKDHEDATRVDAERMMGYSDTIARLRTRVRDLMELVTRREAAAENHFAELSKWQGVVVRLNWLIKEMEKVGAIRLPDHEWATEMRHSIEYPDDDGIHNGASIISSLPYSVRAANLPTDEDSHMEILTDEEEEDDIYAVLSVEASRHAERERIAAIIIQKMWRGHCGRGLHIRLRRVAAIIIQKMWRGHCARGLHIRLRSIPTQEPPSSARFATEAKYYTQMYGCPYPPHVKRAIYIQKMWRGWIGRRDANREWWIEQTPTIGELCTMHSCAITIQKMWRGYRGRKVAYYNFILLQHYKDVCDLNARIAATITIQKMYRGYLGRILPLKQSIRIDELYAMSERNAAATYIQRVWRGFSSRGIVALKDPDMFYESYHLYSWTDAVYSPVDSKSIVRFINTGEDEYKWEKIDGCGTPYDDDDGIVEAHTFTPTCVTKTQLMSGVGHCTGEPFIVSDGIVVKATHCVKLTNITTGRYRYIRIPYTTHGSFDDNGHRVCYYDVATGISRPYSEEFLQMLKMWNDYWEFPILTGGYRDIPFFAQRGRWTADE